MLKVIKTCLAEKFSQTIEKSFYDVFFSFPHRNQKCHNHVLQYKLFKVKTTTRECCVFISIQKRVKRQKILINN